MDKPATEKAAPRARVLPTVIKMIEDHGAMKADHCYRVDADILARLEIEKAQFREATAAERGIAGLA